MKERNSYWDNLRFALICLVVVSHGLFPHNEVGEITSIIIVFINTFHMPLFIFVSGMFHTNKNLTKRIVLLLVYYLYCKILILEINHLVYGSEKIISLFSENTFPWFLLALVSYTLLTYWVRELHPGFILVVALVVGCVAGYDSMITGSEVLTRVVVWFPYYYMGAVLNKDKILEFIKQKYVRISGICIVVAWIGICVCFRKDIWNIMYLSMPTCTYANIPYTCNGTTRLFHYMLVCLIGMGIMTLIPRRKIVGVSKWGTATLQVYIYHLFVRGIVEKYGIGNYFCSNDLLTIIYCFINVGITIILSQDIFSIPTNLIKKYCFANLKDKNANKRLEC